VDRLIVSVAGPPGVGKSTLIEHLARATEARTWYEDPEDFPFLLRAQLEDPSVSFLNQTHFLVTKLALAEQMRTHAEMLHLVEMDWELCHAMWTDALAKLGLIDSEGAAALRLIYAAATASGVLRADLVVLLTLPFEALRARLAMRARSFEQPTSSMTRLLQVLDRWRPSSGHESHERVLMLDAQDPPDRLARRVIEHLGSAGLNR
jgi:deoxyadenosine/deoxycytidine kinase